MSSKSFNIVHATTLTPLLEQLGKDLSAPLADPFTPEVVVVPNSDVARYLKRELSRTLGASGFDDGIVSNISFIYPRQLINANLQSPLNNLSSKWDAEQLTWMIVDTLLANKETIQAPSFETSPLSIARRIASLYDRYVSHRPEMLNHWARGGIDDGTSNSERPNDVKGDQLWQQKLFAELSKTLKTREPDSARAIDNLDDFKSALNSKSVLELPSRISVFGISALSRGARQVLEAISNVSDVNIYLIYFAGDKWPNSTPTSTVIRQDFEISGPTHYLSRRWGAQTIESAAVLGNSQRSFLSSGSMRKTLLGSIQSDIANDVQPPQYSLSTSDIAAIKHTSDGTIQIHACYGLARQAEALRDSILHLMNKDQSLRLRDIAILCDDVQKSAPILNAVFAPSKTQSKKNLPKLDINVVNNSVSTQDPSVEAFLALLHLFTSRCSPADVLDVAQLEPIRRTFDFDDEALALISTWSEQIVIRYGLDADHRQKHGMKDSLSLGTWAQALDRLFTGVAVPSEVDRLGPGGVVPYDGISGSDLTTAGAIAEFIVRIEKFAKEFVPMSIQDWCATLLKIIEQFISVSKRDSEQLIKLKSAVNQIRQNAGEISKASAEKKFSVAELTHMFKESLADGFGLLSSKFEAITVSGFENSAHIPFRVLCIFGADESAFAGSHSDGDDVLSINPCVGEPVYSLDGRQNLLNALMSTSDNLIITCTGSDITNNKETPLAVPVQELLELANQYVYNYFRDGNSFGEQTILVRHPRQNFDEEVLTPNLVFKHKPFTFDEQSKAAYEVLNAEKNLDTSKEQTIPELVPELKHEQTDLKSLVDVVTNPTEYFVKSILKVRIPKMPSDSDKRDNTIQGDGVLNLTIDALSKSSEGRQLLDQIFKSDQDFTTISEAWAALRPFSGQLPPGKLGELIIGEIKAELSEMISELPAHLQSLSGGTDTDCEISFNDTNTTFRVANTQENDFARVLYKRFNESLIFEPWIELAILTLHEKGKYFEAWLVTRGESKEKKKPVFKRFALQGQTNEDRVLSAERVLTCVSSMFMAASAGPVPLFEHASKDVSKAKKEKKAQIVEAIETDLEYSAELNYIFGDKEPDEILAELAKKEDYERLGQDTPQNKDDFISKAQLFAEFVYVALEETIDYLQQSSKEVKEASNDE